MASDFDMKTLRTGSRVLSALVDKRGTKPQGSYPTRKTELFLRGPIPRWWLQAAGKLPGKALHVGLELWFYYGLSSSKIVALNLSRTKESGISRDSARRGLQQLEKAMLVSVKRHAGRKPIVTIRTND